MNRHVAYVSHQSGELKDSKFLWTSDDNTEISGIVRNGDQLKVEHRALENNFAGRNAEEVLAGFVSRYLAQTQICAFDQEYIDCRQFDDTDTDCTDILVPVHPSGHDNEPPDPRSGWLGR